MPRDAAQPGESSGGEEVLGTISVARYNPGLGDRLERVIDDRSARVAVIGPVLIATNHRVYDYGPILAYAPLVIDTRGATRALARQGLGTVVLA